MDEATALATGIWFKRVRATEHGPICSFYPLPEDTSEWVVVSRTHSICGACVERCQQAIKERAMGKDLDSPQWRVASHLQDHPCSFCGRSPAEVGIMLAHEIGSICDKCVDACAASLKEDASQEEAER